MSSSGSGTPPLQYQPRIDPQAPPWLRQNLTLVFQKLNNHAQAFALQQQQISAIKAGTSTTTTVVEGTGGGGGGGSSTVGVPVNNQSGETSYTTLSGDNGALILFSDSGAIAVSLPSQTTPWSCFIANQGALGDGTVTLTPTSGTINGNATLAILPTYVALVAFDGTNWWAATLPVVPVSTSAVTHEWLASYDSSTGAFTQTQPAFSDISGVAAPDQLPVATDAALGVVEPDGTTITITGGGVITAVPPVTFGSGAPSGTAATGNIYFDTSSSPYNGYVYNSGWQAFS